MSHLPKQKSQPAECTEKDCDRPTVARGLCMKHYQRGQAKGFGAPEVVASHSYPDTHPLAQPGQRIAAYECPACGKDHIVGWLAGEQHPGLKLATCRARSASGAGAGSSYFVLAPPQECQFDEKPAEVTVE